MGLRKNSHDTQKMLYEWADVVILTAGKYVGEIPEAYRSKLKVWDVGTDVWFKGFSKDLLSKYQAFIAAEGLS